MSALAWLEGQQEIRTNSLSVSEQIKAIRLANRKSRLAHSARTKSRKGVKSSRMNNIAVFDIETLAADADNNTYPTPFLGVLHADEMAEPIVVWDDDPVRWLDRMIAAFELLPAPYTIYAHNGGKFDYVMLFPKLRGKVMFKGRGIMKASIGDHELRDSSHILPISLKQYNKEEFDYAKNALEVRHQYRQEIIDYCISDCVNTLDIIKRFRARFGDALSVGGVAVKELNKHYEIETLGEVTDSYIRPFYHGGRVECLKGHKTFDDRVFKHYDVNSMYPYVMADYQHPISSTFIYDTSANPKIDASTAFVDLTCNNNGAFPAFDDKGILRFNIPRGRFQITIHEYKVAMELGLIENVKIHRTIGFHKFTNFPNFVLPIYAERKIMSARAKSDPTDFEAISEAIFLKGHLNHAYGRLGIDPRKFQEHVVTDNPCDAELAKEYMRQGYRVNPSRSGGTFLVWTMPAVRQRFANVATAASITGAARSVLLRAISGAIYPIYCDTDSLICEELPGQLLDNTVLGGWKLEAEYSSVPIYAKKVYGSIDNTTGEKKTKAKGVSRLTFDELSDLMNNKSVVKINHFPTLHLDGTHDYSKRTLKGVIEKEP